MKERRRHMIVNVVGAVVLLALGTAGVVAVRGGLAEHGDASALNDPDSEFVPVVGTVMTPPAAARTSGREWTQMSVQFPTVDDTRVQTMVWTRRDDKDFDKRQRIDLEYVAQRPTAARLANDQGGEPEPWRTLVVGVGILVGVALVPIALLSEAVSGRRRRVAHASSSDDPEAS